MNREQRNRLSEQKERIEKANKLIEEASQILFDVKDEIDAVRGEEEDKLDNATEGLLATQRYQDIQSNVDTLDELSSSLDNIIDALDIEDLSEHEAFDL